MCHASIMTGSGRAISSRSWSRRRGRSRENAVPNPEPECLMDLDDYLDEEFPLGDGDADMTADVCCPYCGETVELMLDPGGGAKQEYIEDCDVCCQPWRVNVHYSPDGSAEVSVECADE